MTDGDAARRAQGLGHDTGHDYRVGSPHLEHAELHAWVLDEVRAAVAGLGARGHRPRVLEVGAGHGTFTAELVAVGVDVVVTEMSAASASFLRHRFADVPEVEVVHDPAGEMPVDGSFDAVVLLAVLHHIPDYLAATSAALGRLREGGSFISFQDPLWYARRTRFARWASRAVYLAWRLPRGDFRRGLVATVRRARGGHDERQLSDMVEYHVVRDGVDEIALRDLLADRFTDVRLVPYWSTQSARGQRWGSRWLPPNTFGLVASGLVARAAVGGER